MMKKVFVVLAMVLILSADCFAVISIDWDGTDSDGKSIHSKFEVINVDNLTGTIEFKITGGCPAYDSKTDKVYLTSLCFGSTSNVSKSRTEAYGFGVISGDKLWIFTSVVTDWENLTSTLDMGVWYHADAFVFKFNPVDLKDFELIKFYDTFYSSHTNLGANDWRWATPEPNDRVFYKLNITN